MNLKVTGALERGAPPGARAAEDEDAPRPPQPLATLDPYANVHYFIYVLVMSLLCFVQVQVCWLSRNIVV